jgi:hypothetical protein
MRTLQSLLTILGGQKLAPGYLTPTKPTALECAIDLKRQLDTVTINGGRYQASGDLLFKEAWVGSLAAGQDAIWINDVGGHLDISNGQQPAYKFQQPV